MSLRVWAVKSGELKSLPRAGLLLLGVRCAMRVERWRPPNIEVLWRRGLEYVTTAALVEHESLGTPAELRRELSNRGASASNRLAASDDTAGRCMNYATQTLVGAIDATAVEGEARLEKAIINTAKLSASIAGVLAHAGRVACPAGEDAVEVACLAMWNAIRADIPAIATLLPSVTREPNHVRTVREFADLWDAGAPAWATHP